MLMFVNEVCYCSSANIDEETCSVKTLVIQMKLRWLMMQLNYVEIFFIKASVMQILIIKLIYRKIDFFFQYCFFYNIFFYQFLF